MSRAFVKDDYLEELPERPVSEHPNDVTEAVVGEDEADPAKGSISHVSPLARSMFGKRVGDVVRAGNGEAEIIRIH